MIDIFSLSSKFWNKEIKKKFIFLWWVATKFAKGKLFPTFFHFFIQKRITFQTFSYLCSCNMLSGHDILWGGWSLWVEHYIVEKRHCTLCFWPFEPRKLKLLIKDKCRGDAYGCVYHAQPECAEGLLCPHAHLWLHVYTPEGIKSVRSIERAIPTA